MKKKAVFAGSFDPVHFGHLDIIQRATHVFDEVYVTIFYNVRKPAGLFSIEERLEMLKEVTAHISGVTVDYNDGLLVDYCRKMGARGIVRGLRFIQDFEYEFAMGLANQRLAPEVDTMFFMARADLQDISASIVRELASYGAPIESFVPEPVARRLRAKFRR